MRSESRFKPGSLLERRTGPVLASAQGLAFPGKEEAQRWITRQNSASIFNGKAPIELLISARLEDLEALFQYAQKIQNPWMS